jgi:DUF2924 family protein
MKERPPSTNKGTAQMRSYRWHSLVCRRGLREDETTMEDRSSRHMQTLVTQMARSRPVRPASSLAAASPVCGPGLSNPGRSFGRPRSRDKKSSGSQQCQRVRFGDGGPTEESGPEAYGPDAGHHAGSRMGPAIASRDGCLERIYDSLSKVAFAITGTRWNGPRFFGLRDKQNLPTSEAGR